MSKPSEHDKPRTFGPWRRVLLVAGLVVSLPLVGAGVWAGANLLGRESEPAHLWTEADLPKLPPDAENGWSAFADASRTLARPSIPDGLASACDIVGHGDAKGAWTDAKRDRDAVADTVKDRDNREWIEVVSRSYAMPAFADTCPIDLEADCRSLPYYHAHQLAELALLNQALEGAWNEAFSGTRLLVDGDFAFVVSTRSLLNQMIAFANASRTLELLEVLLAGYQEAGNDENRRDADAATFDKLSSSLMKLERSELGIQRSVMGEYIFHVRTLKVVEDVPAQVQIAEGWGPMGRVFFDRGATLRLLNEDFEGVMAFANKPGSAPPERPRFTETSMWWLRNPVGKIVLDTGRATLIPVLEKGIKEADDLIIHRDALRKRIDALASESKQ
jgi:hypothetical protein